jgi:CheY-like chemotaxis protein
MSNPSPSAPADALLISRDLFFTSKITGTAGALGFRIEVEGDRSRALSKIATGNFRCLFVDLGMADLALPELMAQLPAERPPAVVAFGAHVATTRLAEATAAGCTEVLPRSKFSATLPELLTRYLGT